MLLRVYAEAKVGVKQRNPTDTSLKTQKKGAGNLPTPKSYDNNLNDNPTALSFSHRCRLSPRRTLALTLANAARHLILIAILAIHGGNPKQHQLRQIIELLLSFSDIIGHLI